MRVKEWEWQWFWSYPNIVDVSFGVILIQDSKRRPYMLSIGFGVGYLVFWFEVPDDPETHPEDCIACIHGETHPHPYQPEIWSRLFRLMLDEKTADPIVGWLLEPNTDSVVPVRASEMASKASGEVGPVPDTGELEGKALKASGGGQCRSFIGHGPGHQSLTRCEEPADSPHDLHYGEVPGHRIFRWKTSDEERAEFINGEWRNLAFTDFFDKEPGWE